jgi:hypothetical protein
MNCDVRSSSSFFADLPFFGSGFFRDLRRRGDFPEQVALPAPQRVIQVWTATGLVNTRTTGALNAHAPHIIASVVVEISTRAPSLPGARLFLPEQRETASTCRFHTNAIAERGQHRWEIVHAPDFRQTCNWCNRSA